MAQSCKKEEKQIRKKIKKNIPHTNMAKKATKITEIRLTKNNKTSEWVLTLFFSFIRMKEEKKKNMHIHTIFFVILLMNDDTLLERARANAFY